MPKIIEKQPSFIIAGAPKAGTTSITNWLSQHPQIFIPAYKEPGFFAHAGRKEIIKDNKIIKTAQFSQSWNHYLKLFSNAKENQLCGEATTWYLVAPQSPGLIYSFLPNVKILIILRNPIERAYSHYLMRLRKGSCTGSFEDQLLIDESKNDPMFWIKKTGNYSFHLERFYYFFKPENIYVALFDDLQSNSKIFFQNICEFLDIDETFSPQYDIDNEFGNYRYAHVQKFIEKAGFESSIRKFARFILPKFLRSKFHNILNQHTSEKKPTMHPSTRKELILYYRKDVLRLEKILHRNLVHWLE